MQDAGWAVFAGASHQGVRWAVLEHRESASDRLPASRLPRAAWQGGDSEQEGFEWEQETRAGRVRSDARPHRLLIAMTLKTWTERISDWISTDTCLFDHAMPIVAYYSTVHFRHGPESVVRQVTKNWPISGWWQTWSVRYVTGLDVMATVGIVSAFEQPAWHIVLLRLERFPANPVVWCTDIFPATQFIFYPLLWSSFNPTAVRLSSM